jgi:hypothetical protein
MEPSIFISKTRMISWYSFLVIRPNRFLPASEKTLIRLAMPSASLEI